LRVLLETDALLKSFGVKVIDERREALNMVETPEEGATTQPA
jgi:hypothetical protein